MRTRRFWLKWLSVVFTTSTFSVHALSQEIEFNQCQIKLNAVELSAECGILSRPENPDQPDGRMIDLFVTKLPSRSTTPAADAFTLIQGGPGASSIDMAIMFHPLLEPILAERDVIVVDQRGTGRSNKLACPEMEEVDSFSFNPTKAAQYAKNCLNSHAESDTRYYTTSIAVQDLDAVREAAGYQQLTLYGVSYGTRVVQHYLRRFPAQTRAAILDGVAHVGLNLAGGEIARQSQAAFNGVADRCNATPSCANQFGDIRVKFKALQHRLKTSSIKTSLAHPQTGKSEAITFTDNHLYTSIRMLPYSTEGASLMPLMIAEAYDGNYTPIAAQTLMLNQSFSESFAIGMQNAVMCAEDYPYIETSDIENLDDTYFGNATIEATNVACTHWPRGAIDDDFREPFDSDKPVLILSGETDPITPPANGEVAANMLSNSKHIVVPAHGHGVLQRGCIPALVREFIENISLSDLNTQCIKRERAMPFFVESTGPKP